jgi:phage-related protein
MENIDGLTLAFSCGIFLSPYLLKYVKGQTPNTMGSIVTSLGILGTFLGIFLGLLNFDVSDLSTSVPKLLNGLKTAFLTSIAGLISSLIIKSLPILYGIKRIKDENPQDLEKQIKSIVLSMNTEISILTRIERATVDGLKAINQSFNEFAEKMVADSTQSLIEALEKVMRDFNVLITEQIGDNFKELNEALGKILKWQAKYAEQVEQMTKQFDRTLSGVKQCRETLENISQNANETVSDLANLIEELYGSLDAINRIKEEAKGAFPLIEANINALTRDFSNAVRGSVGEIERTVRQHHTSQIQLTQEMNGNIKEFLNKLDNNLSTELNNSLNLLGSKLASLSEKFVKDYEPLTNKLHNLIQATRNYE